MSGGEQPLGARVFALAALLLGNVALACGPWLVRLADTGPVSAGFWRVALALPFLFLIAAIRGERVGGIPRKAVLLVLAGGVFFGLDIASWHVGIGDTRLANAVLFGNSGSVILMVWGFVMLRRLPKGREWQAIIAAFAGAAILLLVFGLWRLFASAAKPQVVSPGDEDFQKVRAVLANAQSAEPASNLALLGDKRFIFSQSGESFLMFGVRDRSWIALGAPVGRRDERMELLWRFREMADSHAARPGIYGIGADDLPDVVELGFSIQKIGESAAVPLETFSVEGRKRGNLRRAWRKAGEEGATFEVLPPAGVPAVLDELQAISDQWLSHHAGGEKGFTMGGFTRAYVAEFPVAVVRQDGRIVAFATLWTTSARTTFSMDLMRYSNAAPKNIMDYLFIELIAWGREQGYQAFEFGMAPLAGLEHRPLAPIMSRVGRLLFERGEEIYNFQGVRKYKDKYDPVWQPRYLAAPHKWAIPLLLADVGLLSSGGMAGLAKRPKRVEAQAEVQ